MDPPKLAHLSFQKVKFPIYSFAFLNFLTKEAFEAKKKTFETKVKIDKPIWAELSLR